MKRKKKGWKGKICQRGGPRSRWDSTCTYRKGVFFSLFIEQGRFANPLGLWSCIPHVQELKQNKQPC
ncbi:hypothetical protein NC652_026080 [Populus alba x Populus x berolinensis]|nr:hypothetical protein NC652_026080 [Populus alba x Populus x berolinensis]